MQIKHNLLNKNTTANTVSSRGNPVNLSLQPSLHLCKAPFGDRTNKNSIVNRGSPICVRKRNPADCHYLFVWFCLWDSKFVFIIWFSRGSFGKCWLIRDRNGYLIKKNVCFFSPTIPGVFSATATDPKWERVWAFWTANRAASSSLTLW